jgi:NTE family protein
MPVTGPHRPPPLPGGGDPAPRPARARAALIGTVVLALAAASWSARGDEVLPGGADGQALPAARSGTSGPGRPRVGLVLSGGGARGLAHVGVLKVLERERIPIDAIAGTSMGAIIGGLYASGMSADELEQEVGRIDWGATFSRRVDRRELSLRRKEEDFGLPPLIELGYRDGAVRAPVGAVSSRELELLLRRLTLPVRSIASFDALPIPFRAVATDLATGEPVVFAQGDLASALRSSMSVPGVFEPTRIDGRVLADGGLVNNIPVDLARAMGAEVLIVVDIGTPLAPRESLDTAVGVALQTVNILTQQNVARSLATLKPTDILIRPDLGELTAADFEKGAEFVGRGREGAERSVGRLSALSVPPADHAAWRQARRGRLAPPVMLDFVAFEGAKYSHPQRFEDELESKPGTAFDRASAERDARRLAASDDYVRTDYRIAREGDQEGLVFELAEKSWGPDFLRLGLSLQTDFRGDSSFNLTLGHTRHWLTSNGSEWRNLVQIGEKGILLTELYHPLRINLALRNDWFTAAYAGAERRPIPLYDNTGDTRIRVAEFDNRTVQLGVDLGRPWSDLGELRLGLHWLSYRTSANDLGAELIELTASQDFVEGGLRLRVVTDQLDHAHYPTSGYRVVALLAAGRRDRANAGTTGFGRVELTALGAAQIDRHVFDALALLQGTTRDGLAVIGRYSLGGFQRLSGYRRDELNGNVASLLRLGWRTPLTGNVAFARALTVGATFELGNTWPDLGAVRWEGMRTGGSLYVGSDTGLGPVYLGLTYAPRGSLGVNFVVGRP